MLMLAVFVLGAVIVSVLVFYTLVKRLLYVATPNEVLIFCGSTRIAGG